MLLLQSQLYADNNINAVHSELECFFFKFCAGFMLGEKLCLIVTSKEVY